MSGDRTYRVTVSLAHGYQFIAEFPDVPGAPAMRFDEPAPLGDDRAPNAAAVLGAAVGNCLAASLAFCLRKSRVDVEDLTAHVVTHVSRNEGGKFRITGVDVELMPEVDPAARARLDRCEHLFEDFCIVTESVRRGIPVNVTVVAGALAEG
jgi:uncharacterized OsmC-like protein